MTATETKEALRNISEENKALRKQRKYREERIQELRQYIEAYVNDIRSIDTQMSLNIIQYYQLSDSLKKITS